MLAIQKSLDLGCELRYTKKNEREELLDDFMCRNTRTREDSPQRHRGHREETRKS
jgi:hypothetical protein